MSVSKHTPGPWNIHKHYSDPEPLEVNTEDGRSWLALSTYVAQGEKLIAEVTGYCGNTEGWPRVDSFPQVMANARLIAAAPEMLEALKTFPMLMVPAETAWGKQVQDWQEKAMAAIAKAEGRDA